jgi:surface protein
MLLWFKEVHSGVCLGWWSDVCTLKNVCLLWAVRVFGSGFFRLLFLRVDCKCNRPSFLATVFVGAYAFNRDLNRWNVAKVTNMQSSKSTRIVENALTWREVVLLWLEGSVGVWIGVEECGRSSVLPWPIRRLWFVTKGDILMGFLYDISCFLLVVHKVWVCLLCRSRYFDQGSSAFLSCVDCEWTLSPFLA